VDYTRGMDENLATQAILQLRVDRDWQKFHTPSNLAKSISIESAELLECFQWSDEFDKQAVLSELADVLTYCYFLASDLDVTPSELVANKLQETVRKYPIDKSKGISTKYDKL
jgi:dCTP diphosphatase